MGITTPKSAYLKGIGDGAPFILVIIPFATLFGLIATEAGLSVFETLCVHSIWRSVGQIYCDDTSRL